MNVPDAASPEILMRILGMGSTALYKVSYLAVTLFVDGIVRIFSFDYLDANHGMGG